MWIVIQYSDLCKGGIVYEGSIVNPAPKNVVRGKLTDEITPEWKQVLCDCNVKVTYALSPQTKGKIMSPKSLIGEERPYQWLQSLPLNVSIRGQDCKNLCNGKYQGYRTGKRSLKIRG